MKILIGSRALAFHNKEFADRLKPTADWDIISEEEIKVKGEAVETHHPDILYNYELMQYCNYEDKVYLDGHILYVPNMQGLAIVKRSHLWRDWFFEKHMMQYNLYFKSHMQSLSKSSKEFLERRTKASYLYFKERHPNLKSICRRIF